MLYKYVGWNENTKENLIKHQLWFNTPEKFNDPFDILAYYSTVDNGAIEAFSDQFGESINMFSDHDIINIQRISDKESCYISRYGITCFAHDKCDSILMWSHYANKHEGICLGFEIGLNDEHLYEFLPQLDREKIQRRLFPMKYVARNRRPKADEKDLYRIKFDEWEYEKEYRIMIRLDDYVDSFPKAITYKSDKLAKVIIGAQFKIEGIGDLLSSVQHYNNLDFYISVLDDAEYRLNIHDNDVEISALHNIAHNLNSIRASDRIFKFDAISSLRNKYSKDVIFSSWNYVCSNIPAYMVVKYFRPLMQENLIDKIMTITLYQKDEAFEISMLRSYIENQTEFYSKHPERIPPKYKEDTTP